MLARLNDRIAERGGDLSAEEMQADGMLDALERDRILTETIIVVDAGQPRLRPLPPTVLG